MAPHSQTASDISSSMQSGISSGLLSQDPLNEQHCKESYPSFSTLNDLFAHALMDCHGVGYRDTAKQFRKVETALLAVKKTDQTVDEKLLLNRAIVGRKICEYLINQGKMLDHRMQDFIWDFYKLYQFLFSAHLEFLTNVQQYLEPYAGHFVSESYSESSEPDQIMNAAYFNNNKLRDFLVILTGCTISRCMWPENFYNETGAQYGSKGSDNRVFFTEKLRKYNPEASKNPKEVSRAHQETCREIIQTYLNNSPEKITLNSSKQFTEGSPQQILCCLTHMVEQTNRVLVTIVPGRLMKLLSNPSMMGLQDFVLSDLTESLGRTHRVSKDHYSNLEQVLQGYQDRFHFVGPFLEKLQQYQDAAKALSKRFGVITSERKEEWEEFSHSFPIESFHILESRLNEEERAKIQACVDWIYSCLNGSVSVASLPLLGGNGDNLELVTTIKNIMMGRQASQSIAKILSRPNGIDKLDYLLGILFYAYDPETCFDQEAYRRLKDFFGPLLAQYKSVISGSILKAYLDSDDISGRESTALPNNPLNTVGLLFCTKIISMHLGRDVHLSAGKLFYSSQPIKDGVQSLSFSQTLSYDHESVDCAWQYIIQNGQYMLKQIICTPRTPLMHSFLSRAPIPSIYFNQLYTSSLLKITCSVPGIVLEEKNLCQLSVVKVFLSKQQENMLDKFKRFPDAQRRQLINRNPIKIYLTGSVEYICSVILELKEYNVQFEIEGEALQSQVLIHLFLKRLLTVSTKRQLPWLKSLSSITIPKKVGNVELTSKAVTEFIWELVHYDPSLPTKINSQAHIDQDAQVVLLRNDPPSLTEINSQVPIDQHAQVILLRKCPNVLVNGQPLVVEVDPQEVIKILNDKGDFNFDWREQGDDGQDNNITVEDEIRLRSVHLYELLLSEDCSESYIREHPAFFKYKLRNQPKYLSTLHLMRFFTVDGEMLGDFTDEIIAILKRTPGLRSDFLSEVSGFENSKYFIQKNDVLFKYCCAGELSVDQLKTLSCLSISDKRARKIYKRNRQVVYTQFSLVHTQAEWNNFKHWFKPMLEELGTNLVRIPLTGADLLKAIQFGEGVLVSGVLLRKKNLVPAILAACGSLDELRIVIKSCQDHILSYICSIQSPPMLSISELFIRLNSPTFKAPLIRTATLFPNRALSVLRSKEISLKDIQAFPEFFEVVLQLRQLTSQDIARCIQAGMTDAVLQRCPKGMVAKAVVHVMNETKKTVNDERLVKLVLKMNPDALTGKQVAQLLSAYPSYQSVICASPSLCAKIASSDYVIEPLIAEMVQSNLIGATKQQQNDFISAMKDQSRLASSVKKYLRKIQDVHLLEKLLKQQALHTWLSDSVYDVQGCMSLLRLNNNSISTVILSEPFISLADFKKYLCDEFVVACSGHKQKEYLLDIFNKLSEENQSKLKQFLLDQPVNFSVDGLLQYSSSDPMRKLIFDLIESNSQNEHITDDVLIQLAKKHFNAIFDNDHLLERLFAALSVEAFKTIPVEILRLGLQQNAKEFSADEIYALTQINSLNKELKKYDESHPGILKAAFNAGIRSGAITPSSPLRSHSMFRDGLKLDPSSPDLNKEVLHRFAGVLRNGLGKQ